MNEGYTCLIIVVGIILAIIIIAATAQWWFPAAVEHWSEKIPGFEPIMFLTIFSFLLVAVLSFMRFKFKK